MTASSTTAARGATGRPPLANRSVDTCGLARRLLRDEVPNCKLGTLAKHFRLNHQPSHRALDDALATGDLLHLLLERARALGVTGTATDGAEGHVKCRRGYEGCEGEENGYGNDRNTGAPWIRFSSEGKSLTYLTSPRRGVTPPMGVWF